MRNLEIIKKESILGKELKIYGDVEVPLFLAKDIADWIEHTDVSMMCKNLEFETEKLVQTILVSGQNREMTFLTEDGVYEVLMTSRKPIAKEFRKGFKAFLKAWRKGEIKVINTKTLPAVPYKNGGAHWLPSEDVELEQMELRGVARREMAEHFGRSLKAISNRIDLLLPASRKTITKNHNLKKYIGDKVETCNLEDVVMYMFLKMKWNPVQVSEKLEIEKNIIVNMLIEANLLEGVTLEIETVAKTLKKLGNPDNEIAKVLKIDLEVLKFIL